MRIIGLAGWSGSGKTTLVSRVIPVLTGRGLRVSTVKHAHHGFDVDIPGKDSHTHRTVGATEVFVSSARRWAHIHELRGEDEPPLTRILARLAPVDLVIVEGYKRDTHDKIEVRNLALDHPKLAGDDPTVVAIAASGPVADAPVPVFDRDDVTALANFIVTHAKLDKP